jgi:hypothetical protein
MSIEVGTDSGVVALTQDAEAQLPRAGSIVVRHVAELGRQERSIRICLWNGQTFDLELTYTGYPESIVLCESAEGWSSIEIVKTQGDIADPLEVRFAIDCLTLAGVERGRVVPASVVCGEFLGETVRTAGSRTEFSLYLRPYRLGFWHDSVDVQLVCGDGKMLERSVPLEVYVFSPLKASENPLLFGGLGRGVVVRKRLSLDAPNTWSITVKQVVCENELVGRFEVVSTDVHEFVVTAETFGAIGSLAGSLLCGVSVANGGEYEFLVPLVGYVE